MTRKFLRDDGWFQPLYPNDITTTGTATTTGFLTYLTKVSTVDVTIPNGSYSSTGPTIACGSTGTWLLVGQATIICTAGAANIFVIFNDQTNIATLASGACATSGTASDLTVGLQTIAVNPGTVNLLALGNGAAATLKFNATGLSKDSYIMGIRIA